MFNLNLNIDHFATLRNARGGNEPDPVNVAILAENAGATGIVTHLRQDRRHINDDDVVRVKNNISTRLNLEMCIADEIVQIACNIKPSVSTIVPEQPNEVTTSGGLDVIAQIHRIKECIKKLHDNGIIVSLFIEPDKDQIDASLEVGADSVEFNTLQYSLSNNSIAIDAEIAKMQEAVAYSEKHDLFTAAGHSLNYNNMKKFCQVLNIQEYNIGHSIVSRSCIVGVAQAVKEMNDLIFKFKSFYLNHKNMEAK